MASSSPTVLQDPRFEAGRTLIQQGMADEGAIEIFSTLLEECIAKYGDASVETSPAFFEYGNALLRASLATMGTTDDTTEKSDIERVRQETGNAAEARATSTDANIKNEPGKSIGQKDETESARPVTVQSKAEDKTDTNGDNIDDEEEEEEGNDLQLALEMMENAFAIIDEYQNQTSDVTYLQWSKEHLPRILLGIGDCLSAIQRHADAADAYSRVLEYRQSQLEALGTGKEESLQTLQCQRRVCEATVLIAEELLACPDDQDVVTTETKSMVVKADERIEYARGYYDKARDSLQETVYLLGKLAASKIDVGTEKEDVCFLATMIMGVGESLAAIDEKNKDSLPMPSAKKPKLS